MRFSHLLGPDAQAAKDPIATDRQVIASELVAERETHAVLERDGERNGADGRGNEARRAERLQDQLIRCQPDQTSHGECRNERGEHRPSERRVGDEACERTHGHMRGECKVREPQHGKNGREADRRHGQDGAGHQSVEDELQDFHGHAPAAVASNFGYSAAIAIRRQKQDALIGNLRPRHRQIESLLDQSRLDLLAAAGQAFVQPVQRPEVVGVLAGPAQLAVQPEIGAVDRLGLLDASLLQQERAERMAGRLHPAPGLVIGQRVVALDRPAQMREGRVVVALAVFAARR